MRVWSLFTIIICLAVCFSGFSLQAQEADDSTLRPIKRVLKSIKKSTLGSKKPIIDDSALPPVQNIFKKMESVDFHIGRISGHTTEEGGKAQFSVKLLVKPLKDVKIKIVSANENEGKVESEILIFTVDNWNKEQTVSVVGQDDAIVDGDREYVVEVLAGSDDLRYDRLPPQTVSIVNKDNDKAGFTVKQISEITTEDGGTAFFYFRLNSKPAAQVTLSFYSLNPQEGRLENDEFVFTQDNWSQEQMIKVIGQDDIVADDRQEYKIALRKISGEDPRYNGLTLPPIIFYNEDNDPVDLETSKVANHTSEKGRVTKFFVRLKSKPLGKVILEAISSRPEEGVVKPSRLTFTPKDWNKRQALEVTGVDDKIMDGPQTFHVVFSGGSSPDKAYSLLKPVQIALVNDDDDKAGFNFGKISGNTSEDGKKAQLEVSLTSEPTANVKLLLKSGNTEEGKIITKVIEFAPLNWDKKQTITVQGVDDIAADGQRTFQIVTLPAQSKDPNYNDLDAVDIDVINEDNDKAQIIVGPISGRTSENGDEAYFTVRLATKPFSEVSIDFSVSDKTEGEVKTPSLVFNAENWNGEQKVAVVGLNDTEIDGDTSYSVISYPAQSKDPAYNSLDPPDVIVINVDNNLQNILVEKTGGDAEGNTEEGKINAELLVRLPSPPKSQVYVDIVSSDPSEGEPEPSSIVFTPANWDQDQLVTIKGVDDYYQDGPKPYQITLKARSLNEPAYSDLPPVKFAFRNIDNDTAAIKIRLINTSSTENGDMAEFGIRLASKPTSSVVFLLYSTNKNEGKLLAEHAAFKEENWNKEQIISVKGIPDYVVDRNAEYHITCGEGAISGDKNYNKMKFDDISMVNKNVDQAKFVISAPSGPTIEDGTKATFKVNLNSKPRSNVAVELWSGNIREGVIDRKKLQFSPENWNKQQVVTVTGVDDQVKDDERGYKVVFSSADSKDRDYHGLTPPNVNLINIDNKRMSVGLLMFYFKTEGDLADVYESTPGYGVSGGYVWNSKISLAVSLASASLSGSDRRYLYHYYHTSDYTLDFISLQTGIKYSFLKTSLFKKRLNFFVQPGLGIHSWSATVFTPDNAATGLKGGTRSESGVEVGLFSGAGIEFSLIGNSFISLEYNYNFITLGESRFMTLSISANYPF